MYSQTVTIKRMLVFKRRDIHFNRTNNVHRPPHSSLDCKLGHHSPFRTFFHNQKILFIRCGLYKDAGKKAYRQDEHFSPIQIKSTID
jgi:hypothetical protein